MGLRPPGIKPAFTGLDVIVSKAGKIEALYTFLDPAEGEDNRCTKKGFMILPPRNVSLS
jgi:hypothetical protein